MDEGASQSERQPEETKSTEHKHPEVSEELSSAIAMLERMEISKKESEDTENYKKALLSSELLTHGSFEELKVPGNIVESLYLAGFKNPSVVQKTAIPAIADGNDVAFQSHSGSGKTVAFIVGALMKINLKENSVQVMILSPTRDLAQQIYQVLEGFKKTVAFTSVVVLGDLRDADRNREFTEQIVVGTPGTLKALLRPGRISGENIKMMILDEADALLEDGGLGAQTVAIIRKVQKKQLVLFSATFTEEMKKLISSIPGHRVKASYLEQDNLKPKNIGQFYMEVPEREKVATLIKLYGMIPVGQSIIFVRRRERAEKVVEELQNDGFDASFLHGQLEAADRDRLIKKFKDGEVKVLVTTNVLSRGLDVPQLNLAVNYDIPRKAEGQADAETYLHRIGRTGRFNRTGVSIDFVSGPQDMKDLLEIQKAVGHAIPLITLEGLEEAIAERVRSAGGRARG